MDPFAALADPLRRDLVARLARGSARVVDLTAEHDVSRPAISRHLRLLAEAGLVSAEDRGRERHYRLERGGLRPVADLLAALGGAAPPVTDRMLDGLELEVRRTGRDRRAARTRPHPHSEPHSQPHSEPHSQPHSQEDTA
ncbi:DNA-binding transcriptional ArsR family regulator [Nocardioides cavernae]|uniref:DNA-binding transcriptional ArsR family regulator n=1 Tax=Nocardioides cavernae TaxID=1921566 RepID=A0A7Y9KRK8_9ACTN|nr:metalloregulator ArsR/SmtB family transcription factor [Nocardioides cavernae]NYE35427.1 DNA-binding transcriptional ArsR family regulator [Nocardioides cavernae]